MQKEIAENDGAKILNGFCKLLVGVVEGDRLLKFSH